MCFGTPTDQQDTGDPRSPVGLRRGARSCSGSRQAQGPDRADDPGVQARGGADDAAVGIEPAAFGEIERPAQDVGRWGAALGGDQRPGGVVPDPLDVAGLGGHAEVGVGLAAGDDGVLALAVEADGLADRLAVLGGEVGEDAVGGAGVGVGLLDRGGDADLLALVVVEAGDADGALGVALFSGQGLVDPLAVDGVVDRAVAVGLVERVGHVAGQVGAGHGGDDGRAGLDIGEGDGVLLAAEEALGAVDGVEGPEARGAALAGAEVDRVEHGPGGGVGPAGPNGGEGGVEVGGMGGVAQKVRGLLGDQIDPAQALGQHAGDDRLAGEVGHGHRAVVVLGDGPDGLERGLDLAADERGLENGPACGLDHAGVINHTTRIGGDRAIDRYGLGSRA